MRTSSTLVLVILLGVICAAAAPPRIPSTNEVVRYEREQPVFQSKAIPREQGDVLLSALEGGWHVQGWRLPPGFTEAISIPARHWLSLTLTNGNVYRIGVSFEGSLVYLPDGLYEVREPARGKVGKAATWLEESLRQEIVSTPKPFVYKVSIVDDGGTLSGIARLFYGDATKWKQIYEANRDVIKNPNVIDGGVKLTIPKLP